MFLNKNSIYSDLIEQKLPGIIIRYHIKYQIKRRIIYLIYSVNSCEINAAYPTEISLEIQSESTSLLCRNICGHELSEKYDI